MADRLTNLQEYDTDSTKHREKPNLCSQININICTSQHTYQTSHKDTVSFHPCRAQ